MGRLQPAASSLTVSGIVIAVLAASVLPWLRRQGVHEKRHPIPSPAPPSRSLPRLRRGFRDHQSMLSRLWKQDLGAAVSVPGTRRGSTRTLARAVPTAPPAGSEANSVGARENFCLERV